MDYIDSYIDSIDDELGGYAIPVVQPKSFKTKTANLPNGERFHCVDTKEVPLLFREIFEEQGYLRHGICLKDRMTIFDVGANIGMFAYFVSMRVSDATIFAFEPLPPTYQALTRNVAELALTGVHPLNVGLSSRSSTAQFSFYPHSAGWSSMYPHDTPKFREIMIKNIMSYDRLPWIASLLFRIPKLGRLIAKKIVGIQLKDQKFVCRLRTISEIISENGINRIDLLKVDVERAELDVLLGIQDAHWSRIAQAVVEVQSDRDPENRTKITRLLMSKGFRVTEVEADYLLDEHGRSTNCTLYAIRES